MSGAAVIPSLIPPFVVVAMRRAEARLIRQLSEARAFTAESAVELSLNRSMDRRRLQGLIDGGAVRVAANGRHFLDDDGWTRYQGRRRQRVLLVVSTLVALIGIGLGLLYFRQ
ncbi:MAG: hypothetical protein FJ293_07245 [Planctomycetes bacterium]|nr:hypothetical protein [Planctomycetota bacterium]